MSSELDTIDCKRCRTAGSRSMSTFTVEPVPTPSEYPSSMYSTEAFATFIFFADWSIDSMPANVAVVRIIPRNEMCPPDGGHLR